MRNLILKTTIAMGTLMLGLHAGAKQITTNLDLACQDATFDNVYTIIIEPETIATLPEETSKVKYTGEYLATVFNISQHETIGTSLYSGNKEFLVKQVGENEYTFKSDKLNLDLTCSKNEIVKGIGVFSGTN
jgi:hypothetical protein